MSKTGRYYHSHKVSVSRASVGTSFDKAKLHSHDLHENDDGGRSGERYSGKIEGILVQLSAISGAGRITVRGAFDQDFDEMFLPDTEAVISTGLTTATDGSVAYRYELPIVTAVDFSQVFLCFKTDAGTVTVDSSTILWSE